MERTRQTQRAQRAQRSQWSQRTRQARRAPIRQALAALLLLGCTALAQAAGFPERAITLVVGFPPGSGPDVAARVAAGKLADRLGQPVVVENRVGAGGTIGTAAVARAAPDGYTLLLGSASALTVSPALYKNLSYDPVKSFTPVIQMLRGAFILSVRSELPITDLKSLIAYARANPGKLNYGSSGNGSLHHLCMEMLKSAAGLEMTHVPYKGSPQNWLAMNGGEVELICDSMPGPAATLKSGKARAIAVTGDRRVNFLPDVPTFAEQGMPAIDIVFWYGMLGPAGLPADVVDTLNRAFATVFADREIIDRYAAQGIDMTPGTPAEFGALIAREAKQWPAVIEKAGVKVD